MLKRVIAIATSVLTVMLMIGPTMVEAGTGTIGGTSVSQCICFGCTGLQIACSTFSGLSCTTKRKVCSIDVQSILSGLGNVTQGGSPTPAAYAVNLFVQHATVGCFFQGQPEGETPQPIIFEPIELSGTALITPTQISKNGRALGEITFFDDEIIAALFAAGAFPEVPGPGELCPDASWEARVLVEELQAFGRLFRDDDGSQGLCDLTIPATYDQNCTLGDAKSVQCVAPQEATFTNPFDYTCATLCHNSDTKVVDCPTTPQVLP